MKRILLMLPLAACNCLETGGNSRMGRFEAPLPPALVANTSYDLQIFDYELERSTPASIASASSSDESIAAVTVEADVVSFDVKKAGPFALDFTGEADGDELIDAFDLSAIEAVRLELAHHCDASYVANRPADVEFWFSDSTRFRGNGYGWYPVTVENATLDPSLSTAHTLRIMLGDQNVTITSSLAPDNEQPAQLVLNPVSMAAIDSVVIVDEFHSPVINGRRLEKDEEITVRAVPAMGTRALCGARVETEWEVSADSDCMLAVTRGSSDLKQNLSTNGELIVVVAVAYGICQLTAAIAGESFSQVLDFDLTEPQRSSSSDFD